MSNCRPTPAGPGSMGRTRHLPAAFPLTFVFPHHSLYKLERSSVRTSEPPSAAFVVFLFTYNTYI